MTLTLQPGEGRDVVLRIVEAERAEIVGQIPSLRVYHLRLPTTSFDEGLAVATRLRENPSVRFAEHAAAGYFDAQ